MFQSTPPARGATQTQICDAIATQAVSIHAPRAGGDSTCCKQLHALQIACHKCDPDAIR